MNARVKSYVLKEKVVTDGEWGEGVIGHGLIVGRIDRKVG